MAFKKVSKSEFDSHLNKFDRDHLKEEMVTFVEPPMVRIHDKNLMKEGKFVVESVVAEKILDTEQEYFIKE